MRLFAASSTLLPFDFPPITWLYLLVCCSLEQHTDSKDWKTKTPTSRSASTIWATSAAGTVSPSSTGTATLRIAAMSNISAETARVIHEQSCWCSSYIKYCSTNWKYWRILWYIDYICKYRGSHHQTPPYERESRECIPHTDTHYQSLQRNHGLLFSNICLKFISLNLKSHNRKTQSYNHIIAVNQILYRRSFSHCCKQTNIDMGFSFVIYNLNIKQNRYKYNLGAIHYTIWRIYIYIFIICHITV